MITECGFCENGVITRKTKDYMTKVGDRCPYCQGTGLANKEDRK